MLDAWEQQHDTPWLDESWREWRESIEARLSAISAVSQNLSKPNQTTTGDNGSGTKNLKEGVPRVMPETGVSEESHVTATKFVSIIGADGTEWEIDPDTGYRTFRIERATPPAP
jgi:hypothetical protein